MTVRMYLGSNHSNTKQRGQRNDAKLKSSKELLTYFAFGDIMLCTCISIFEYLEISKGKVGYPSKSTRDIYQHIPPIYIYGLYNGCMGQYGVIFGEQLSGYPPKGTEHFPLKISI